MPDLTSLLSRFLVQLYNGTWSSGITSVQALDNGTGPAPAVSFASEPTLGFYRSSAGLVGLSGGLVASGALTGTNINGITFRSVTYGGGLNTFGAGQWVLKKEDGNTNSIGLDVTLDGTLAIRTKTHAADAHLTCANLTASGNVAVGAASYLNWGTGRTLLNGPGNGTLNITNSGATAGVGLDVATDAVLKVRNRAQNGDAIVSALWFQTTTAIIAAGGGASPTFVTIGGTGPATAAQNGWLKAVDSAGAAIYIPVWK